MIPPQLPTAEEIAPFLAKLEANAGSVILIAVELPSDQNFCRVGIGHFTADARARLKRALQGEKRRAGK